MKRVHNCGRNEGRRAGFTLIELLIYAVIFSISSIFLVNILTSITETQVRQTSVNDVNQQVSFVASTIQRLVRESSLIENDAGVASTTLVLRMSSSSIDKTYLFTDASSTAVFMKQVASDNSSTTLALTDDKVTVGNFTVTKFEVPGGPAVIQVDLTLNYNTSVTRAKIARTWRGAISRISAATFDSSILPNSTDALDVGGSSYSWKDAYFSGSVNASGKLGVGTTPSELSASTAKIKANGNIAVGTAGDGLVLKTPNGSACYLISITNTGAVTSTLAGSCP